MPPGPVRSTVSDPPWASAIDDAIASPMPIPSRLVVKNGSNTSPSEPGSMPWPWSTELFRVQSEAVQPRLEEAVLGRKDAAIVLEDARRAAVEP